MPAVHPERHQGKDQSAFSRVRFVFSTKEQHSMTAKMKAPIQIDLNIKITNGSQDGVVTIRMGHACFPTEQEFRDRIAKFVD
ncbi:hypothetical protein, partial [Delftia acidovorans]|uniref:hypothetical protein n=1 Tax=Delftia acidovorans TaxID=80866 RepID=UPI001D0CB91D